MKVWIHIFIFAVSSLAVLSQTCPSERFSAVFVASLEQSVPNLYYNDPKLNFFTNIMQFSEDEIQDSFEYAIHFFNETYGLDFSASTPNEQNVRILENAIMSPFIFYEEAEYVVTANNWIQNGNTRSRCYQVHNGGIRVTFSGVQTLFGSYGGAKGKTVEIGDALITGIFKIDNCRQSSVNIFYRSIAPVRQVPFDGTFIGDFDTHNSDLGHGLAYGIIGTKLDEDVPGLVRVSLRFVFTF